MDVVFNWTEPAVKYDMTGSPKQYCYYGGVVVKIDNKIAIVRIVDKSNSHFSSIVRYVSVECDAKKWFYPLIGIEQESFLNSDFIISAFEEPIKYVGEELYEVLLGENAIVSNFYYGLV